MNASTRESRCERARAWAALAPDGELSVLEQRLLDAHLANCGACRCFAQLVVDVAAALRAAAAEQPSRRVALPAAPVRRSAYVRLRSIGMVAAVAAMALGIAIQAPVPSAVERPAASRSGAPAEVEDAEQRTIRVLRHEALLASPTYSDRPARAFATNQPERALR